MAIEMGEQMPDNDGPSYMRVAQLRAALDEMPDDGLVVLAKDGEGNSFSPLSDSSFALYVPESTWAGDIYEPGDDEYDNALEGGESESCVVLWPTN